MSVYDNLGFSVSASEDKCAERHSRRDYIPDTACRWLSFFNAHLTPDITDDKQHINDYMHDSIEDFNIKNKAKHPERVKDYDYAKGIEDGTEGFGKGKAQEQLEYHYVIALGDKDSLKMYDDDFDRHVWKHKKTAWKKQRYKTKADAEKARLEAEADADRYIIEHLNVERDPQGNIIIDRETGRPKWKDVRVEQVITIYTQIAELFKTGYYNKGDGVLLLHGAEIHLDEPAGGIHLDLRFSAFITNQKRGLDKRISMNKCFDALGYPNKAVQMKKALQDGRKVEGSLRQINDFFEDVKKDAEKLMKKQGFHRVYKGSKAKHLHHEEYKEQQEMLDKAREEVSQAKQEMLDKAREEVSQAKQEMLDKAREEVSQAKQEMLDKASQASQLDDMGLVRADFKEYLKDFPVKGGKTRASVLEQWEEEFSSSGEGFDMEQESLRTRKHQERSVESILYDLNAPDENAIQKGAGQRDDV